MLGHYPNGSALQFTNRIDPAKSAQPSNGAVPIRTPTNLDETVFLCFVPGRSEIAPGALDHQ